MLDQIKSIIFPGSAAEELSWEQSRTFWQIWGLHVLFSWLGFVMYFSADLANYKRGLLAERKLPSRHPLMPFWMSQLKMVPIVLYNQFVVWPMMHLFIIFPIWSRTHGTFDGWSWWLVLPILLVSMLISDFMWYWGHRWMHTPYAWKHFHKMHHIAPQAAISTTFVHPVEYAMFSTSVMLPAALLGLPVGLFSFPLAWGMLTGCGAHSGYSEFADGDKHNAHHLYHTVNFGLFMVMDIVFKTHWSPGDPEPKPWGEAMRIYKDFPSVFGKEQKPEAKAYWVKDADLINGKKRDLATEADITTVAGKVEAKKQK